MNELAGLMTAGGGLLTILGGGAAFVWKRFDIVVERERAANEKRFDEIDAALEECHAREERGKERRGLQLTVIELLWQELERLAPDGNRVLVRAKKLLDDIKATAREEG